MDIRLNILQKIEQVDTTREKPSSSAGFRPISSAGRSATDKALQLMLSNSAPRSTLLLNSVSSSASSEQRYW